MQIKRREFLLGLVAGSTALGPGWLGSRNIAAVARAKQQIAETRLRISELKTLIGRLKEEPGGRAARRPGGSGPASKAKAEK